MTHWTHENKQYRNLLLRLALFRHDAHEEVTARRWGYGPGGGVGLILLIIIVLALTGHM
jgi:hypothetical protein